MTASAKWAALAALATAIVLVVWTATTPGVSEATAESPRLAPGVERAPATPATLPDGIASEPQPLPVAADPDVPAAAPGFTIAVTATRSLPSGGFGPRAIASLELGISHGTKDLGEPLMKFETAPDGKARIAFPRSLVPAPIEGKRPYLWLRSEGVGLLTRTELKAVPKDDDVVVEMIIPVLTGTVVEGRILGPDGLPAAGSVTSWHFGEAGISSGLAGIAGSDGVFRLELRNEGRHGLLAAGASRVNDEPPSFYAPEQLDLGTGFSELFDVDFTLPVPFINVHVSGPGVIRGRIVDDTGAPASGVSMVAVLAELDDETGSLRLPYPRVREIERLGGGHLRMRATTDADGSFAFPGLRRALFHVRAAEGSEKFSDYPILLTEQAVFSDGAPLELRLSRPHLAIHVREVDGSVPQRPIQVHQNGRWMSTLEGWPEEPGLLVTLSPRDAHRGGFSDTSLRSSETGPGEFVVELAEALRAASELELDVGVLGGELPWRPRRVVVPAQAGRVNVELILPAPAPLGALLLDVVDGHGAAVVQGVRIRIEDPVAGAVLVDVLCDFTDAEDWPLRIPLPEGAYRLVVEGHPRINSHHGTLSSPRAHGAHEQSLLITAGASLRVTATLGDAARLALRVIGVVTEADREAIRATYRGSANDEFTDYWAQLVSLRLEREGRWPEQPKFRRFAMEGTTAAGTHLFPSVAFGSEETSEALSPGECTLVATTAGGRVVEQKLTLVSGQTLNVTLRFE